MKKAIFTLLLLFNCLLVLAQGQKAIDTLAIDLDLDKKTDSVFYNREEGLIVCKLSTQGFSAIKSDTIERADEISYISVSAKGFQFTNNWMRAGYHCDFMYNKDQRKIQLVAIDRYAFGPANNDGSGESDLNLLTGNYEGNWNYYDERKEQLVKIPVIRKKIMLPTTYLQRFSDGIFSEYEDICSRYYLKAKEKMLTDSKIPDS